MLLLAFPVQSFKLLNNWQGFDKINQIVSFGDSWSTTGFDINGEFPSANNPQGNPFNDEIPYGYTSSGGPNYLYFITQKFNKSLILNYNFACGGATVDSEVIAPYRPDVKSILAQIQTEYIPTVQGRKFRSMDFSNTLFTFFDGINDVLRTPKIDNLNAFFTDVIREYFDLVKQVYYSGSRNFLFLNVPPVELSPQVLATNQTEIAYQHSAIALWNKILEAKAKEFAKLPGVNILLYDTNKLFQTIIDNPSAFGFAVANDFCPGYTTNFTGLFYFDKSCTWSFDKWFWKDTLHINWAAHRILAQDIVKFLE